jgi:hypothetical protein
MPDLWEENGMTDERYAEIVMSLCGDCWQFWDFSSGKRTQRIYPVLAIKGAGPADGDGNTICVEFHNGKVLTFVTDIPPELLARQLYESTKKMSRKAEERGALAEYHHNCALYLQMGDELIEHYA